MGSSEVSDMVREVKRSLPNVVGSQPATPGPARDLRHEVHLALHRLKAAHRSGLEKIGAQKRS